MSKPIDPERHAQQGALVREMVGVLRDWLGGHRSRADVTSWTRQVWPENAGQGGPFPTLGTANTIFTSLYDMGPVREQDALMYLRWLSEGESFRAHPDPLLTVRGSLLELPLPMPEAAFVRFVIDGLGWYEGVQFGSLATGRPFFAFAPLFPLNEDDEPMVIVNKSAGDDSTVAALDFMETLGIDDKEVSWFHDSVKLDALPTWELWRLDDNANEMCMDTFRSRAKAVACKERFEARGHRQTYWVRRR